MDQVVGHHAEPVSGQEEEYIKRPEIKIALPDALKLQLVDDWENVTKKNLVRLLARRDA